MYRKSTQGWAKHIDFILLDFICLQIAFVVACIARNGLINPYSYISYRNLAVVIACIGLMVSVFFGSFKNVLKRGYYIEFIHTVHHVTIVMVCILIYLFFTQKSNIYSRVIILIMSIVYLILSYGVRFTWKRILDKKMKVGGDRRLLIVTVDKMIDKVIEDMRNHNYEMYTLVGIAVIDKDYVGKHMDGTMVVANKESVEEYVCNEWVDEVLIVMPDNEVYPEDIIDELAQTGVTVHYSLSQIVSAPGKKQFVEKIGNYTVITTSINFASTKQLIMKRVMDIVGGLIGCIITGIIFIFVAPAIYISSPGPIFFAQERVGKNGKKFKMYKFRSMYMDAEERKAELMKENKLEDAKMFKMDFDPRVIGNKILPDGTHKTGIGDFIRRTSLDEFPQFFNVLKGDMSIVGTRPPLTSETNLYEAHHYARLAIKPGITGMWQVSGRSNITDFEEVVRLDREYISNWNIGLDIKILLKTVLVVFKKDGSM